MPIAIGEIIREEIKNQGLKRKEFGTLINRHEKTVANILKRKTIDTELLKNISKALNRDFFNCYYDEEPLKKFKENELKEFHSEIESLKKDIAQKDELLKTTNKYIQSQEDVIRLLKEKERFLSDRAK